MSAKRKTIMVSEKTHRELAKLGTLEDNFDSVIQRLIEKAKEIPASKDIDHKRIESLEVKNKHE